MVADPSTLSFVVLNSLKHGSNDSQFQIIVSLVDVDDSDS